MPGTTDGACVSGGGAQDAVDVAIVVRPEWLPAASAASTEKAYIRPHESPAILALVVVASATLSPSRYTLYETTPTSSVDAFHDSAAVVCVTDVVASPPGFDGGCVSRGRGQLAVEVAIALRSERPPS